MRMNYPDIRTLNSDSAVNLSETSHSTESNKLKFGVDRILSNDTTKSAPKSSNFSILSLIKDSRIQQPVVLKPRPSVSHSTPCSECVTSLFRSCHLSTNQDMDGQIGIGGGSLSSSVIVANSSASTVPYGMPRYLTTTGSNLGDSLSLGYVHVAAMRHLPIRQISGNIFLN